MAEQTPQRGHSLAFCVAFWCDFDYFSRPPSDSPSIHSGGAPFLRAQVRTMKHFLSLLSTISWRFSTKKVKRVRGNIGQTARTVHLHRSIDLFPFILKGKKIVKNWKNIVGPVPRVCTCLSDIPTEFTINWIIKSELL